jgi:biopolymer transport protein ExbB
MSFDLLHIWSTMSLINKLIAGGLVVMAILMCAITVERMLALSKSARLSRAFVEAAAPHVRSWDPKAIVEIAEKYRPSSLAFLFEHTTSRFMLAMDRPDGGMTPTVAARNEAARQQEVVSQGLRRGLPIIATIGSIAPFVGLLGTVIGIIVAFQNIGATGAGGLGTVSAGIAEALVETAFGLMVAIPSVILFNYLNGRVQAIEASLGRSLGQLIDEMEYHDGRRISDSHPRYNAIEEAA